MGAEIIDIAGKDHRGLAGPRHLDQPGGIGRDLLLPIGIGRVPDGFQMV